LIYEHACTLRCEGIVSQQLGSPHRSGRTIQMAQDEKSIRPSRQPRARDGLGEVASGGHFPSVVRCPTMAIAVALFCYGRANQPISAQAGYAAGTKEILECWFKGRQI